MKRNSPRPVILRLPTFEMHAIRAQPQILPFPGRRAIDAPAPTVSLERSSDAELRAVRDRLFRMIVANQWNRTHGHRAS